MNYSPETIERSKKAYRVLCQQLEKKPNQTMTYGELASRLNCHHRALRPVLAKIQDECKIKGWPTLTVLVVKADSGKPGDGCDASSQHEFTAAMKKVKTIEWPPYCWW